MNQKTMKIEQVKPYWRNPKRNKKSIPLIKDSIIKFGYNCPVMVDKDDIIIIGHARTKAMKELKGELIPRLTELEKDIKKTKDKEEKERLCALRDNLRDVNEGNITVDIAEHLNETQAKEFRIADNKLAEISDWDMDKLKFEVRDLQSVIGFTELEITDLLVEIDPSADGMTEGDLNKAKGKVVGGIKKGVKDKEDSMIEVICPNCSENFFIDKKDIKQKVVIK